MALNKSARGTQKNNKKWFDFSPMQPGHGVPFSVFTERLDFALMGRMADLRPKPSFYLTEKEKFRDLEYLFDVNWVDDPNYIYAITYFEAKEMGMRLSPTLTIARLIYQEDGNPKAYPWIEKLIKTTFTRPDFFANLTLYYKAMTNKYVYFWETGWAFQLFPEWAAKILRNQFASLGENTLKSQRLDGKMLKTKNLIMGFRPKPKNQKMSDLYKAVIEGNKSAKLQVEVDTNTGKVKSDHVRAVLSSNDVEDFQKKEYVSDNISNIPINALIRNLTQVNSKDADKLFDRLDDAFTNGSTRFINPFDLLHLNLERNNLKIDIDPAIKNVCSRILEKHFLFEFEKNLKTLYMVDVSGSIYYNRDAFVTQIKYLTLLKENLKNPDSRIYGFADFDFDFSRLKEYSYFDPYTFAEKVAEYLLVNEKTLIGSTNFYDSTKKCLQKHPHINSLIVTTDEGFNMGSSNSFNSNFMREHNIENKSIIINVEKLPKGQTPFEQSQGFIKIYGKDGKNLAQAAAAFNFDKFKEKIKKDFFRNQNLY